MTREALAQEFGLSPDVVTRLAARLKARGLIAEVQGDKQGFIPGRAATAILMSDILAAFRSTDLQTADGALSPGLRQLIADPRRPAASTRRGCHPGRPPGERRGGTGSREGTEGPERLRGAGRWAGGEAQEVGKGPKGQND